MSISVKTTARKETLDQLKELLLLRREALRKALNGDLSLLAEFNRQTAGDLADFALDSAQYEISSELISVQSKELARTDEALLRMHDGTYGLCDACGEPIAMPRLMALPYTTLCITHAREAENSQHRGGPHARWSRSTDDDDEGGRDDND